MEGDQLTFFIRYQDDDALITLSEYDTVQQLKIEIDCNFNIAVDKQDISGWHAKPTSDDTILKVCSNLDINCLEVREISLNRNDANQTEYVDHEMDAITSLKEKLPIDTTLNIRQMSLQDAVSHISLATSQEKALLLFLHNSRDVFTQRFLAFIRDGEVKSILDETFFIIGWDIEDPYHHSALVRALEPYGCLSSLSHLITDKTAAAICLLSDNNRLALTFCLRGDISHENVLNQLRNVQKRFNRSGTFRTEDARDTSASNYDHEMEAITRLKEKLPIDTTLNIRQMSLQDAVSHISLATSQEKALLLFLHNSRDVFTQRFLAFICNGEVKSILDETFFIIGWDIEDPYHHSALVRALEPYGCLSILSHLITDKTAAAICLLSDNNRLALAFCLRDDISHENVLNQLRNVQKRFNRSGTFRTEDARDTSASNYVNEIEAIKSLRRKLPNDVGVRFREFNLDDAIHFIRTDPLNERKPLFLYLHNSKLPFSQMFSLNLRNRKLATILNNFLVLGWDVENPNFHNALVSALNRHVNLARVSNLVTHKISIGVCILPVRGAISVFMCLRGNITLEQTIKDLQQALDTFNDEIRREQELEQIERGSSNQNDLGSKSLHRIWADMLGDRDYDSFEFDQHMFLKEKIGFALIGPPQEESGYGNNTMTQIDELYNAIKGVSNEMAEYRDHIEISFIYNCLEPLPDEKIKRASKFPDYNPQTDVNPVPIFVLRRCRGSQKPCRVFIDNSGRVYQNWREYLTENNLPKCQMVVPRNGRYQVINDEVQLEQYLSPACHLASQLFEVADIVSSVTGLAAGAVFLAATTISISPLILTTAAVGGAAAGTWAIGRSLYSLYDRNRHNQPMSFAHSEARGAYLNIVAGSLGFVGAGANMALAQLATRGVSLGQGATYLVNTIGVLNISAGGASIVNSGYEVFDQWYNDNQTPSLLTILQLSSSVLFFGHAVYNFRGAQTIIDETQARVLKDYQDSLRSNRHRKMFNKLTKEAIRIHGDGTTGRAEVISAIRNIQNKDEVFAALTRNNRAMNRAGIRFWAEDGRITLGGIAVDMNEFIGLNKRQTETFLMNLAQERSSQPPSASGVPSSSSNISLAAAIGNILSDIKIDPSMVNLRQMVTLTSKLLDFCNGEIKTKVVNAVHQAIQYVLGNVIRSIREKIDEIIRKNSQFLDLLHLGISFFSKQVDEWERRYQQYQRTGDESYFDQIFLNANPTYIKRTVFFFEFVVQNSYSGETLTQAVLTEFATFITAWFTKIIFENEQQIETERRRMRHSQGFRTSRVNCNICGGYYFKHETYEAA